MPINEKIHSYVLSEIEKKPGIRKTALVNKIKSEFNFGQTRAKEAISEMVGSGDIEEKRFPPNFTQYYLRKNKQRL